MLEQAEQELDDLGAYAGVPAAQGGREQGEHAADDLARQRGAGAHRVRAQEVELERRGILGADAHAGQVADPGRDAIDGAAGLQGTVDDGATGGDALAIERIQRRGRGATRHALEVLERWHGCRLYRTPAVCRWGALG